MAAVMLRHAFGSPRVSVTSAGTSAVVGAPMTTEARAILSGLGLPDEPVHVARQLRPELIRQADLILGLTREHRRQIVHLEPSATPRTFTVREFGFVASQIGQADLEQAARREAWRLDLDPSDPTSLWPIGIAAVQASKGLFPIANPEQLDVSDPYGHPIEVYAAAAARILPAVEATAAFFADLPGRLRRSMSPASPTLKADLRALVETTAA
jgi:protein-tyrosine phosphatase